MPERGMPDGYRLCAKCHEYTMRAICPRCGRSLAGPVATPATVAGPEERAQRQSPKRKGPNATERRYRDQFLNLSDARYEALTFRMANGKRYTPDWVVFSNRYPVECIEVKGSYKFGSHNRAKLAFAQCRIEFSGINWTWATLDSKTKKWTVE